MIQIYQNINTPELEMYFLKYLLKKIKKPLSKRIYKIEKML